MKITKDDLKKMITEELESVLEEEDPKSAEATANRLVNLKKFDEEGFRQMVQGFIEMSNGSQEHAHRYPGKNMQKLGTNVLKTLIGRGELDVEGNDDLMIIAGRGDEVPGLGGGL